MSQDFTDNLKVPEVLAPAPQFSTRCTTSLWKQGCIELAIRKLGQKFLSDDKQDAKDPFADMPFWLEDFTDNLKVPEMLAPAHSSRDSDSEHFSESGN